MSIPTLVVYATPYSVSVVTSANMMLGMPLAHGGG
jgi:hypothetical protein